MHFYTIPGSLKEIFILTISASFIKITDINRFTLNSSIKNLNAVNSMFLISVWNKQTQTSTRDIKCKQIILKRDALT